MESHKVLLTTAFIIVAALADLGLCKKTHYIHWNKANPMFRLDNTDHMIDVNVGNLPWEYDQVNIICPVTKNNVAYPERHVIYSVSKEEFDSCRITNPKPKVVAVCSKPHQLLYFTITFRSFSPTPGGLEFHPGQDYYFISTSSREDLHRRVGGGCATHNMKMIFRVAENGSSQLKSLVEEEEFGLNVNRPRPTTTTTTTTTTERPWRSRFNFKSPYARNEYTYYYHPRDLMNEVEDNSVTSYKKINGEAVVKTSNTNVYSNDNVWNGSNVAMRFTSGGQQTTSINFVTSALCLLLATLAL